MAALISIVICTHNRSNCLATVLGTLACQTAPAEDYEILVVDNHSTDGTKRIVEGFAEKISNLHYIYEFEIGLSAARNRGRREACGEYIGYLDDDAKAPPEWVSTALKIITSPAPTAFGGPYFGFYNRPKPAWFKDEYGTHVLGNAARSLKSNEYLTGNNFCVRRELLAELGGFTTALGMRGKKIAYGEETRLLIDIRKKYPGAMLYYEPKLFIYHLVNPQKMDLWREPLHAFINGQYSYRTQLPVIKTTAPGLILEIVICLLRLLKSCTWDLLRRDRQKYPLFQNFLIEKSFRFVGHLGWNLELLTRIVKGN